MTQLKDPPDITIRAGYAMTKARMNWPDGDAKYSMGRAIELVEKARDYHVKHDGALNMMASEALYFLNEAAHAQIQYKAGKGTDGYRLNQGAHAIGRAHNSLRLVLKELGYREITDQDFAKYGLGGR